MNLRFTEEQYGRLMSVKEMLKQKREAFQIRMIRLEQRQAMERNELMLSQQRFAATVAQIRTIEMNNTQDISKRRRMQKENEMNVQQTAMKAQKEIEHLRELQICKVRHLKEVNDLEIAHMEDLEDLLAIQKQEEFDLLTTQSLEEAASLSSFEKQKSQMIALQVAERQKSESVHITRQQKRQEKLQAKARRAAARNRETAMLSENPLLKVCLETDPDDDTRFSEASGSECTSNASGSQFGSRSMADSLDERAEAGEESDGGDQIGGGGTREGVSEAMVNAERNARGEGKPGTATEEEREMKALLDLGRERQRALQMHHKKLLAELRAQHKSQVQTKQREQRKKMQELLDDHTEELEGIKADQEIAMTELAKSHAAAREQQADTESSLSVLGMMLPAHILSELEAGKTPEPTEFNMVTLFFTDIHNFKNLVATTDPIVILNLLKTLYSHFDEIISKYDSLYKVECVSDTYMVVSGLSSDTEKTEEQIQADAEAALRCVKELQGVVETIDLEELGIEDELKIRVGVHSGPVFAGLIGNKKMSRYCLFGDTVNTSSRMCTNSAPGRILVSPKTKEIANGIRGLKFEERGAIDVKGKGKMVTYWLE
ncbi:Guanylate cyclase 2G [Chytridiales sp. JEL 0842]|nr:Guanylate cyclase 2G [Chytridiales sp. JEL 0842]